MMNLEREVKTMKLRGTLPTLMGLTILPLLLELPGSSIVAVPAMAAHVQFTKTAKKPTSAFTQFETKGNFAAWALHTFSIPVNHQHPLPDKRYQDVNNTQRYVFGQAVSLGLVTPSGTHTFGTNDKLTKAMAASGLVHLLHIQTKGLTPYRFALQNGWFSGTTSGNILTREDMPILYTKVKRYLDSQRSTPQNASGTGSSSSGTTSSTSTGTTSTTSSGGASGSTSTTSSGGATGATGANGTSSGAGSGTTSSVEAAFQIPTLPASGELNLVTAPTTASISANPSLKVTTALPPTPGQKEPIVLNSVIYNPNSPNIVVTGQEKLNGGKFYSEVWLQINELGTASGTQTNQWQYPVMVNPNGTFSYALHVPFMADAYEIQVAPPLTTAQTSLNYTFDTNEQSVSKPFTLKYSGQDTNQQLGLLTSVWANYLDPSVQSLAEKITNGLTSPLAKVQAVFNWEAQHIGYNGKLLVNNGYGWSTTEETLASKVGICVDYANVADAFLRSLGIPTQMVVGYASDAAVQEVDNGNNGHAWNRSWINGKWVYFDPTWSRLYFLSSANSLPGPHDLWVFQPQWFNPPTKVFNQTHKPIGIQYQ